MERCRADEQRRPGEEQRWRLCLAPRDIATSSDPGSLLPCSSKVETVSSSCSAPRSDCSVSSCSIHGAVGVLENSMISERTSSMFLRFRGEKAKAGPPAP